MSTKALEGFYGPETIESSPLVTVESGLHERYQGQCIAKDHYKVVSFRHKATRNQLCHSTNLTKHLSCWSYLVLWCKSGGTITPTRVASRARTATVLPLNGSLRTSSSLCFASSLLYYTCIAGPLFFVLLWGHRAQGECNTISDARSDAEDGRETTLYCSSLRSQSSRRFPYGYLVTTSL